MQPALTMVLFMVFSGARRAKNSYTMLGKLMQSWYFPSAI
jgi:hypothetical protein